MMHGLLNCTANEWVMIAGSILTYGVAILAGAALVKYLLTGERRTAG